MKGTVLYNTALRDQGIYVLEFGLGFIVRTAQIKMREMREVLWTRLSAQKVS